MTSTHLWRVWFGEAPIHGPFTSPVKGIRVSFQSILCAPASYNFNTFFGHECCIQFKIISCYSLVWGTAAPLFLSMTMVCDCLCHCWVESFRCHPHFCILYCQSCELFDSCAYIVDLVVFTTVLHHPSSPPPFSTTNFHHHPTPPIYYHRPPPPFSTTDFHHHHSPPPIFSIVGFQSTTFFHSTIVHH